MPWFTLFRCISVTLYLCVHITNNNNCENVLCNGVIVRMANRIYDELPISLSSSIHLNHMNCYSLTATNAYNKNLWHFLLDDETFVFHGSNFCLLSFHIKAGQRWETKLNGIAPKWLGPLNKLPIRHVMSTPKIEKSKKANFCQHWTVAV